MAIEAKRGCGYRQAGGLYLVSGGLGEPCERLPVEIVPCAHCGATIRQTRSFQWEKPEALLVGTKPCKNVDAVHSNAPGNDHCERCPVCSPSRVLATGPTPEHGFGPDLDPVGLLWVGEKFYPTAEAWAEEASKLGVSKRIAAIPKGLVVGKTWIFVAHPKRIATRCTDRVCIEARAKEIKKPFDKQEIVDCEFCCGSGTVSKPGIFHAFVPTRIELLVTPSMEKQKWVAALVKQGVTLVRVPEDDPDHAPTVTKKSARKKAMDKHGRKHTKAEQPAKETAKGRLGEEAAVDEES